MSLAPINAVSPAAGQGVAEVVRTPGRALSAQALRNASPEVQRKEVAAQFEAILVRQLLKPTMISMLGDEGGAASGIYGDIMTESFAQQLTRGGGLGLGRMLEQQLTPKHERLAAPPADSAETTDRPVVHAPLSP